MKTFVAREALTELSRKLILLKSERHKNVRNDVIDSMLDEGGEISCLDIFIEEGIKEYASK